MPRMELDVDQDTYELLAAEAVSQRRPIDWQAEVTLRRAVGLPFPYEHRDRGEELALRGPGASA
jgi:hypothetical protein